MRSSSTSKLFVALVTLWCIAAIAHAAPEEGLRQSGKVDMGPVDPAADPNPDPSGLSSASVPPPAIGDPLGPGETGPALDPPTPEEEMKNKALSCIAGCNGVYDCANSCITATYGTSPAPAAQGGPGSSPAASAANPASAPPPPGQPQAPPGSALASGAGSSSSSSSSSSSTSNVKAQAASAVSLRMTAWTATTTTTTFGLVAIAITAFC